MSTFSTPFYKRSDILKPTKNKENYKGDDRNKMLKS